MALSRTDDRAAVPCARSPELYRTLELDACCWSMNTRSGEVEQQIAQLWGIDYYATFSSSLDLTWLVSSHWSSGCHDAGSRSLVPPLIPRIRSNTFALFTIRPKVHPSNCVCDPRCSQREIVYISHHDILPHSRNYDRFILFLFPHKC